MNLKLLKKIKKQLNDFLISKKIKVSWKQLQFEDIEKEEEYEKLYKREGKIKIDFHGNRDFYYLIKGIAYDLNENNEGENIALILEKIEKYIERILEDFEIENFYYLESISKISKISEIFEEKKTIKNIKEKKNIISDFLKKFII